MHVGTIVTAHAHNDLLIKGSLLYMEQKLDTKLRVEHIADRIGIFRRQPDRSSTKRLNTPRSNRISSANGLNIDVL